MGRVHAHSPRSAILYVVYVCSYTKSNQELEETYERSLQTSYTY